MDLGLTDDEFGKLTPRLFQALVDRKEADDLKWDIRFGRVCAQVVNFSMVHPEKPVAIAEFVPSLAGKAAGSEADLTAMDPKEQFKFWKNLFAKKVTRKRS